MPITGSTGEDASEEAGNHNHLYILRRRRRSCKTGRYKERYDACPLSTIHFTQGCEYDGTYINAISAAEISNAWT